MRAWSVLDDARPDISGIQALSSRVRLFWRYSELPKCIRPRRRWAIAAGIVVQRYTRGRRRSAMSSMVPAVSLAAACLARCAFLAAADHGAARLAELALVLEQARCDLVAVGNELVAKPLSIALASVLVLHSDIVRALRGGRRSPHRKAQCQQQPGSRQRLASFDHLVSP